MWRLRQLARRTGRHVQTYRQNRRLVARQHAWETLLKDAGQGQGEPVLIHVGCGDIQAQGFINIDARKKPHVHIVTTNLFRLEMIPSEVADLIYMSHVLEHVGHRDVVATLTEMQRLLRPGGVLRVSVPDFDHIVAVYKATSGDVAAIEQPLMGGQDYPFNFHFSVFNERHLQAKMLKSGFQSTRTWDPLRCEHHNFEDWASMNINWRGQEFPISLNIEAIK